MELIDVALVGQAPFRSRLRSTIDGERDMSVAGEASTGDEALPLATQSGVRILIAEAAPGCDCSDLIARSQRRGMSARVIVLSGSPEREAALRLIRMGAAACLSADEPSHRIVQAIRTVASGGSVLDPKALDAILLDYRARCDNLAPRAVDPLSPREAQVLTLLASGLSAREIATHLGLSPNTVALHRHHIMSKLRLHKAAHLVRYALREGLVVLD
jgi:DNA-binding NarL/FixJ family response regulator